jgi:hypothetical protein
MITENLNDLPVLVYKVTPLDPRRQIGAAVFPSLSEALAYSASQRDMRIEVLDVDAQTIAHAMSGANVGNLVKVIFPPN